MGTKDKVWLRDPSDDQARWLWKAPRPGTGEHWAEKLAWELGVLMELACPRVDLALRNGEQGTITRSFLPPAQPDVRSRLMHGNELLALAVPGYPLRADRKHTQYSVEWVLEVLDRIESIVPNRPERVGADERPWTRPEQFVGYLAFDAWIGNTDRHHQNWGLLFLLVLGPTGTKASAMPLAPSFDHASSLGRDLTDEKRLARLDGQDGGNTVETYAARAKTPFYVSSFFTGIARRATPHDAFMHAARRYPEAGEYWRDRIRQVDMTLVAAIVEAVPSGWMSEPARRFALRLLQVNSEALQRIHIR